MLSQSRLWGGVMAGLGAILGLFCVLWAVSSTGSTGGAIFGLAFAALIAVPLIAGGVYIFMRGRQGEVQEQDVAVRRRTLESESLARGQIADRLTRQRDRLQGVLAAATTSSNPTSRLLLEDAAARLEGVAGALRRSSYDRAGSFDALAADASDPETLRSIDATLDTGARSLEDQVSSLTRSLAAGAPDAALVARLSGTISRLENATNERSRVVTSGEQKALPTVAELLRGTQPSGVHEASRFTELKAGDALTYNLEDFVVSGRLEWTEGATAWYTYLLGGGEVETWLYVEQGGTILAVMRPTPIPEGATTDDAAVIEGVKWPLNKRGTATVTVEGADGRRGGLFVGYRRFEGTNAFLWLEEWDEGPKAMFGQPERAEMFDLWIK